MRALLRQSCTWGAVLFAIGCGTDSGDVQNPDPSDIGSENRGGSGAGGSAKRTGGTTNEGGKAGTSQGSSAGGKPGATTGASDTTAGGGSSGAGGRGRGRGGAAGVSDGQGGSTKGTDSSNSGGTVPRDGGAAGPRDGSSGTGGGGPAADSGTRRTDSGAPGADSGPSGAGGKSEGSGGGTPGTDGGTGRDAGSSSPADGGATAVLNCSGPALTGGTQHCSSNNGGDVAGGYSYQIWSSGSGGCITPYGVGAAFKATWNNSGDFLARVGLGWDETKTYDQLGVISAEYAYKKSGNGGSYSYIGVYGWSNDPLVEYYIVDDWLGSKYVSGTRKGSLSIDGGTYDIYVNTRTNQPSIHGNATFQQFFSFRTSARQCGHISVSEHFKKWDSLGMKMGKMYEARLLVEAGGGSGSVDYTYATVTAN